MNKAMPPILTSLVTLFFLFMITGCAPKNTFNLAGKPAQPIPVTIDKIVVLDNSALDALDSLGTGKKVVGLAKNRLPDYLPIYRQAHYADVSWSQQPNLEHIASLAPDVIIIGPDHAKYYDELSEIAPILYLQIDPQHYVASFTANVTRLASINQKQSLALQYLQALKQRIALHTQTVEHETIPVVVAQSVKGQLQLMPTNLYTAFIYDTLKFKPAYTAVNPHSAPLNAGTQEPAQPTATVIDKPFLTTYKPAILFVLDQDKADGQSGFSVAGLQRKLALDTEVRVVELDANYWGKAPWGIESLSHQLKQIEQLNLPVVSHAQ